MVRALRGTGQMKQERACGADSGGATDASNQSSRVHDAGRLSDRRPATVNERAMTSKAGRWRAFVRARAGRLVKTKHVECQGQWGPHCAATARGRPSLCTSVTVIGLNLAVSEAGNHTRMHPRLRNAGAITPFMNAAGSFTVWEYELYGGAQLAPHPHRLYVLARLLTPPKGVREGPRAIVHLPRNTRCRFLSPPPCAFLASSPRAWEVCLFLC
eukprot:scaffold6040_cov132-Isochrysis_galbana.AAC.3